MKNTALSWSLVAGLALLISVPAPAGLIAYWSFDLDATDAMGAHDGILVNGAALTSGNQGHGGGEALSLGGGSGYGADYMRAGNPDSFDFNSDFTWHAYVQTNSFSGAIFSRAPVATDWNQGSKALFLGNGNGEVQWDTGWVGGRTTGVSVRDGDWHQVIATYSAAADILNVFVDPSPGASAGLLSAVHDVNRFDEELIHSGGAAETDFRIGMVSNNFRPFSYIGLIDEAAVFDTALAGAELDQLITGGPASFTSTVPEAGEALLALGGLAGLLGGSRRRKRS